MCLIVRCYKISEFGNFLFHLKQTLKCSLLSYLWCLAMAASPSLTSPLSQPSSRLSFSLSQPIGQHANEVHKVSEMSEMSEVSEVSEVSDTSNMMTTQHLVAGTSVGAAAAVSLSDVRVSTPANMTPSGPHTSLQSVIPRPQPITGGVRQANRIPFHHSDTMETTVTVSQDPIVLTNLAHVMHTWATTFKKRQKLHEHASLHFAQLYRKRMLPYHVCSVISGCLAVAEFAQTLLETTEHKWLFVLGVLISAILFVLSLGGSIVLIMMQQFWRHDTLAEQHESRSRLCGQFSLQCERMLGSLRLQHSRSSDSVFETYQELMNVRRSMMDNNVLLELPKHLEHKDPFASGTPPFIPVNTPHVWATPYDNGNIPREQRPKRTRSQEVHKHFQNLVSHIQRLAKVSPIDDLKRTQAPTFKPDNNVNQSPFIKALQEWQTQANAQSDQLAACSRSLQRKERWWNVVRAIPSVITQVTTSVNLVQHLLQSQSGLAMAWSVIVVVLLLLQEWFVHLHKTFAFAKRAADANAHARQLRNFSEQITTVAIYHQNVVDDADQKSEFIHHHLEELKNMRQDIRNQFPIHIVDM